MGDFKRIWLQCPEDAGCCRKKGAVMDRITEAAELALQNSDFGPEIKKHFEGIIAERDELRAQLEAVREAWPAVMEMALQEWNANREEESIIPQSIQHIQYALNPGKDGG